MTLGPFEFGPSGVRLLDPKTIEEWTGPLRFALWCQRASPWWIGDLLNAGDAQFGEAFSQACEGLVSGEMLQRYESVARKVPVQNRLATLSWSSHAMVARLNHEDQRIMLERAVHHGWSSEELRRQVIAFVKDRKQVQ
jgi:hypothetical protein